MMLRDIPRVYLLMLGFIVVLVLLLFWYKENYERDSDVLQLNEIILTNAITEVDQESRLYEGALLLLDTFESNVWEYVADVYPACSKVEFEYTFDISDTRFTNINNETVSSGAYYIGGGDCGAEVAPSQSTASHMTKRPIQEIKVLIKEKNDVADWTYVSTVVVDAESRR